jgi:indole-3-glycerol phosphate synthase
MLSAELLMQARAELAARQARVPLADLKDKALMQPGARDAVAALRADGLAVIAEVHAASPAKGVLAGEYESGGANAVSVPAARRSGESLAHVREVRSRVDVPVLCRELVLSGYQLWEARAHGADLVVLSAAVLEQDALVSLIERAGSLGMTAMVEVRDGREVVRAVGAGARVIAVNARDLTTLEVDRDTVARLLELIPENIVRVAECGRAGRRDLFACARAGADAVVAGESLLADGGVGGPRETVAGLVAAGSHPAVWRGRRQEA